MGYNPVIPGYLSQVYTRGGIDRNSFFDSYSDITDIIIFTRQVKYQMISIPLTLKLRRTGKYQGSSKEKKL